MIGLFLSFMKLCIHDFCFLDWRNLDLELDGPEVVCVMGDSGSGKSLFLRAIADLVVSEGEAMLGDVRRDSISASDWRKRVGYLAAEILWWEESVGEHFLKEPTIGQIERLRLPPDCMNWSPSRLSMGERQRLGILRLLDRQPKALLLDEPTANLDAANVDVVEKELLDYIRSSDVVAIWVTHSVEQANRVGDRVLLMKDRMLSEANRRDNA